MGSSAQASLSETMALEGDHVVIKYDTEFNGADLNDLKKKMRKVQPKFSDESHYMRDVQLVIDENYLNYQLFQLFYAKKTYSLTETLIDFMPEDFLGGGAVLRALMSTEVWKLFFPELGTDYEPNQRMDLRCGWSKDYLNKGKLSD